MPRKNWERITINVEPGIQALVEVRAQAEHRSVSGHLAYLIKQDLEAAGLSGLAMTPEQEMEAFEQAKKETSVSPIKPSIVKAQLHSSPKRPAKVPTETVSRRARRRG